MTPDDIEEGNAILDAMAKYDSEAGHESHCMSRIYFTTETNPTTL